MNYQHALDHNMAIVPFMASDSAETMDKLFWGTEEEIKRVYARTNYAL